MSEKDNEVVFSLIYDRAKILDTNNNNMNYEQLSSKYDELCSIILKLPKSIISTHLFNNFIFNLHLEFLGFDYVKIIYKSSTITLVEAGLNLDDSLYENILQILTWLDINQFKINMVANKYNTLSHSIQL